MNRETTTDAEASPSQKIRKKQLRFAAIIAWSFWGIVIICALISLVLRTENMAPFLTSFKGTPAEALSEILYWVILIPLVPPVYATVGAIVASRRPYNVVGWICLAGGLVISTQDVAWQYASIAFAVSHGAGAFFAMAAGILGAVEFPLPPTLLLLYFPSGHLVSRRWRVAVWVSIGTTIVPVLVMLFAPVISIPGINNNVPNPLGIPVFGSIMDNTSVPLVVNMIGLLALLAALISVLVRWRHSRGEERQQLKWFAYMGAVIALTGTIAYVSSLLPLSEYIWVLVGAIALAGLVIGVPIAIGFAMLRYRLYDIDLIINRTIVYTLLTAALVLVYVVCVLVLQSLLNGFTQGYQLATVGSTLAIATLFQPLRLRIQDVIDRRFYRRKYDAAQTLAAFSTSLRGQTDLEQLHERLMNVVNETMQPTHVSLWLRNTSQHTQHDMPPLALLPAHHQKTGSLSLEGEQEAEQGIIANR